MTPREFLRLVEKRCEELSQAFESGAVGLATDDPVRFTADFVAALTYEAPLDIFLGPVPDRATPGDRTRIMVATGGTTGAPRFAVHTWETLGAAASGLQVWLGSGPLSSVCLLPMRHMSGFMQLVRAMVSGGRVAFVSGTDLEHGNVPDVPVGWVNSVVPTQLARMLDRPRLVEWLRQFRMVFVGGSPASPYLLDLARTARLPLAPCYGMTETAAQIATQAPEAFLSGGEPWAEILPHARVRIVGDDGSVLPPETPGRIAIRSKSLCHGYWLQAGLESEWYESADQGVLNRRGQLRVLGRIDAVIISGGEKVNPAEVEDALRATDRAVDTAVLGAPDPEWGEVVVAVVAGGALPVAQLEARLRELLDPWKVPRRWKRVTSLPRDDLGKLDKARLQAIASEP